MKIQVVNILSNSDLIYKKKSSCKLKQWDKNPVMQAKNSYGIFKAERR